MNEINISLGDERHHIDNLEFEFMFMNSNNSHLSEELEGFFYPNLVFIVGIIFYFIVNLNNLKSQYCFFHHSIL